MNLADITPVTMVKNEEYWIHYVLREILEVFPYMIMLDTGSTDDTIVIAEETAIKATGALEIVRHDFGSDAHMIGNGRNLLRRAVETEWMFLIDGDEIWTMPQIKSLLSHTVEPGKRIVMAGSHNLEDVNGQIVKRTHDVANKDILFARDVEWIRIDYPFEGYGLSETIPMEHVQYLDAQGVFCWHVRHTQRSSKNAEAFFRQEKYNYFPYDKGYEPMPHGWLGDIDPGYNTPYELFQSRVATEG